MKNYLLVIGILLLTLGDLFGEIKNGYEKDIAGIRMSLRSLKAMLSVTQDLTGMERRKINESVKSLINHLVYKDVTDDLLNQFRLIAPDLYNAIDTLKDGRGREVDVYVKFFPKESSSSPAFVALMSAKGDLNRCDSEYGAGSVSVKIWFKSNALLVLAHEFGHVQYIVPHLAAYLEFYKRTYRQILPDVSLGHLWGDPSGKNASAFERRFCQYRTHFRKLDNYAIASPWKLIAPARRRVEESLEHTAETLTARENW